MTYAMNATANQVIPQLKEGWPYLEWSCLQEEVRFLPGRLPLRYRYTVKRASPAVPGDVPAGEDHIADQAGGDYGGSLEALFKDEMRSSKS
jgi:hypothetical protein